MKVMFVFGTRPEAIKLAPIILEAKKHFDTIVCVSEQHKEMLYQVTNFFNIHIDYNLHIMKNSQSLFDITSNILLKIKEIYETQKPDIVIVQGDTTTAFAAALSAFYLKIKIAHIEAGLRSFDLYNPFPEEANRKFISAIATYHFAPTKIAYDNLLNEGIKKNVYLTGNSVVDALYIVLDKLKKTNITPEALMSIDFSKRIILLTSHRRESFGKPMQSIFEAIKQIALEFKDIEIVYPVHLNPNVKNLAYDVLSGFDNIKLIKPLTYPEFVYILSKSHLVITDSGGVQEEAPAFGIPVLVIRKTTERQEGIKANVAKLVGTNTQSILRATKQLIADTSTYNSMSNQVNPYGDGKTSQRIISILKESK
ncbi:UDP-N-acetylglucosamine 2-epimerase [Desulfurella amilsii]|uniref:UDP-N-acetylglucosamine 2-epimerase (non-hydrolyzing) n=1 Tax=Desulfurella amilsii TaxID=1562698 RepID=A0A1X4XV68_9BACT|nr:UDP-N-acetylglucosamine 2-epimerase (non-hydrolyzing) [Desulfurella amilsii]OSS41422.1 UDP-N-acetylglucosamine 2-epimerase [Desulfurella amilsii]